MRRRNEPRVTGDDTIVAIVTPPGQGGVAIVRAAGPGSLHILSQCFRAKSGSDVTFRPFQMKFGFFTSPAGETIDEVLAVFMPHGHSYTGLEQIEIYCHGGRQVARIIMDICVGLKARPAEPGEFTKLAFLSGRIDLAKAEAVAEIITADTASSYRASREHLLGAYGEHIEALRGTLVAIMSEVEATIDFPEEEITTADRRQLIASVDSLEEKLSELILSYQTGRIVREGFRIVIAGRPNAGKSSLFNLLLKQERALVNPTAGTTRDYLSEWIDMDGLAVNLIDTAGIRGSGGKIERLGHERSRDLVRSADLVMWVVDISSRGWRKSLTNDIETLSTRSVIYAYNKIDLCQEKHLSVGESEPDGCSISCATRKGVGKLRQMLAGVIRERVPDMTSGVVVTSARHKQKLSSSLRQIREARRRIIQDESPEIVSFHLRNAITALDEITGKIYTEEILERIFGKFCIGK